MWKEFEAFVGYMKRIITILTSDFTRRWSCGKWFGYFVLRTRVKKKTMCRGRKIRFGGSVMSVRMFDKISSGRCWFGIVFVVMKDKGFMVNDFINQVLERHIRVTSPHRCD